MSEFPLPLFFFFFLELRSQLSEQVKVLDAQLEQKTQQLQDLSDYLRRRGEIEAEYARSLEKLSERFTLKTKKYIILTTYIQIILRHNINSLSMSSKYKVFSLSLRKEHTDQSVSQCWSVLLTQTKQESRDHSSLSEICSTTFTQRLTHCIEDTHRLAKKVPTHINILYINH